MIAASKGNLKAVKYFVQNLGARVEEVGRFVIDGDTFEGVTAIWCACGSNGTLEVVKFLVEAGADVNHRTTTNSTPLRIACFEDKIEVVKYLVSRGADINICNSFGDSNLSLACYKGYLDVVKFLVESGADVNKAPVNDQNTPLHSAAEKGHLEIVIFLMNHGALMLKNSRDETPALTAATAGQQAVLDYIIFKAALSPQERTGALEVLGAEFVNRKIPDIPRAIAIWRQCLEDRKRHGLNIFPKKETRSNLMHPWRTYKTLREIESLLNLQDENKLMIHAVSIRHRILGSSHPDTIYGIKLTGAVYADNKMYDKCIDFWLYVIALRISELQSSQSQPEVILDELMDFVKLFSQMLGREEDITCAGRAIIIFKHCLTVLDYLTLQRLSHLSMTAATSTTSPEESITENYNKTLRIAVLFVSLFCRLEPFMTPEEDRQKDVLVSKLVVTNHRHSNNSTVLHIACLKKTYDIKYLSFDEVPIVKVVNLLLSFKQVTGGTPLLSPRAVDDLGNTALHVIAKVFIDPTTSVRMKKQVVCAGKILVEHGGDVDHTNQAGESFRSIVGLRAFTCAELAFLSASQVIPSAPSLSDITNDPGTSSAPFAPTPVVEQINPSLCVLCLDARVDTLIVPCNHVCLCSEDVERLKATASRPLLCPVCRTTIETFVKVFLS